MPFAISGPLEPSLYL